MSRGLKEKPQKIRVADLVSFLLFSSISLLQAHNENAKETKSLAVLMVPS
jgi:hypothetical protein